MTRLLMALAILTLVSCNKPLSSPEEIDPIYKDLQSELSNSEKDYAEKLKKVEEAQLRLRDIIPQRGQTRKFYGDYHNAQNIAEKARQKMEFYRERVSSRKFEARNSYIKALESQQSWPDPKEYNDYRSSKRAAGGSRNWRDRYPAKSSITQKKGNSSSQNAGSSH